MVSTEDLFIENIKTLEETIFMLVVYLLIIHLQLAVTMSRNTSTYIPIVT